MNCHPERSQLSSWTIVKDLKDQSKQQDPSASLIPMDGMYAENAGAIFSQDDRNKQNQRGKNHEHIKNISYNHNTFNQ